MAVRIILLLAAVGLVACADETAKVRSVLRDFNRASQKPDPQLYGLIFTPNADYRDSTRALKGRDALVSLFVNRPRWSERTAPMLRDEEIRLMGDCAALVDAQLFQYGTTTGRSSIRVALVLEKDGGEWKISSWRTLGFAMLILPE
jgi:ketosteroid isomerase-like protein